MVRLERTFDRNADIVGLLLRQGSEFYAELFQVERRDLLVEVLGKDVDVVLVLAALGPELDLGENLVGEGRAHHEARMARSEERRVGKECVSTCRSRWSRYH